MTYNKNDIIRIAKRENNTMRSYLVLNRLQAKHIQADPVETIEMFDTLAEKLSGKIDPATTLIIGFAETATAIGAHLAVYHGTYYIQTTREDGSIVCPYISHRRGKTFIGEGDYIILDDDGTKHVCGGDKIFQRYEEVK